jgi:hypothetical protein
MRLSCLFPVPPAVPDFPELRHDIFISMNQVEPPRSSYGVITYQMPSSPCMPPGRHGRTPAKGYLQM